MKHTIKNRSGQSIVLLVEPAKPQKGLAFVMHGLGGYKEQPHLAAIAQAFSKHGYTVVRFDTTNTFGESAGRYEDATVTNYYQDLEDVISWAHAQKWYQEPFFLAGHSLGAMCVALFAESHPEKVKGLAPISTVVSGSLSLNSASNKDWHKWKETGWRISQSASKPGVTKRLKWSHMEDRMKYDLLPKVKHLTMPVLLIVGSEDESTPPEQQKLFFDALPGARELHVIKDAPHTFMDIDHLSELSSIFSEWVQKFK